MVLPQHKDTFENLNIAAYDTWYSTSAALDANQTQEFGPTTLYQLQETTLLTAFQQHSQGSSVENHPKIKAAVLREKGSNSEREMAYAMQLAGFEVTDIHMTDLIQGRTDLSDFQFIAAVGDFLTPMF